MWKVPSCETLPIAGISPIFFSPSFIAISSSTIRISFTFTGLTSSVNSLSDTSPIKFLYAFACKIGVVMKNGTITTKASKIKAIIKLFFASFEVLELLSNIMSIIGNVKIRVKSLEDIPLVLESDVIKDSDGNYVASITLPENQSAEKPVVYE